MAHEALDTFVMEDGTVVQKGRIVSSTHPGVLLDDGSEKLFRAWVEPTDSGGDEPSRKLPQRKAKP